MVTGQRLELETPWFGTRVFERGVIWLNGDRERDEECETFMLVPVGETAERLSDGFWCKTGRCPYDLAVSAILLRAAALAPDHVTVGTGDSDDWDAGRALLSELGLEAGEADAPAPN